MIEYPSIINSSKAPRKACIGFDKIDGSNLRFKFTQKRGFDLYGSRTQLIDESHPHLGQGVVIFKKHYKDILEKFFQCEKDYRDFREIIVYAEFWGKNSFAGIHLPEDEKFLTFFDVLVGHKNRKFVSPKQFVKDFGSILPIPKVVYEGNLNEELIKKVRENTFDYKLNEGLICKGLEPSGAFRGNMWMCKIKTLEYLNKIVSRGLDLNIYGE